MTHPKKHARSLWEVLSEAPIPARGAAMVGLLAFTAGAAIGVFNLLAQEPEPKTPINCKAQTDLKFTNSVSCLSCHKEPNAVYREERVTDFLLLNESALWANEDKHRLAYVLLDGDLGRKMGERLGIANVLKEQSCLSCHANWMRGMPEPAESHLRLGVNCQSCHGPAEKWGDPEVHGLPHWRARSPREKCDQFGMVDVRNPIERARQCFSCHIGSVEQGKVLTHEMYAAGHPPLPSIELETFGEQMLRHWRYLNEKPDFEHRETLEEHSTYHLTETPQSKSVMIGGIMALRYAVDLFANQAASEPDAWPELAVFDCFACHHDLKTESWRQKRGFANRAPGRPQRPDWPSALVKLGIRHVASDEAEYARMRSEFQTLLGKLDQAVTRRPFGVTPEIQSSASELVVWLDRLASEALEKPFDREAAATALAVLLEIDERQPIDYDSVRQVAWAIKTVAPDAMTEYASLEDKSPAAIEKRRSARQASVERVEALFDELKLSDYLTLRLPAGQANEIAKSLPSSLGAIAEYDPDVFRERLEKFADELKR